MTCFEANDLADEDSDISMLQIVERSLARQKRNLAVANDLNATSAYFSDTVGQTNQYSTAFWKESQAAPYLKIVHVTSWCF